VFTEEHSPVHKNANNSLTFSILQISLLQDGGRALSGQRKIAHIAENLSRATPSAIAEENGQHAWTEKNDLRLKKNCRKINTCF